MAPQRSTSSRSGAPLLRASGARCPAQHRLDVGVHRRLLAPRERCAGRRSSEHQRRLLARRLACAARPTIRSARERLASADAQARESVGERERAAARAVVRRRRRRSPRPAARARRRGAWRCAGEIGPAGRRPPGGTRPRAELLRLARGGSGLLLATVRWPLCRLSLVLRRIEWLACSATGALASCSVGAPMCRYRVELERGSRELEGGVEPPRRRAACGASRPRRSSSRRDGSPHAAVAAPHMGKKAEKADEGEPLTKKEAKKVEEGGRRRSVMVIGEEDGARRLQRRSSG